MNSKGSAKAYVCNCGWHGTDEVCALFRLVRNNRTGRLERAVTADGVDASGGQFHVQVACLRSRRRPPVLATPMWARHCCRVPDHRGAIALAGCRLRGRRGLPRANRHKLYQVNGEGSRVSATFLDDVAPNILRQSRPKQTARSGTRAGRHAVEPSVPEAPCQQALAALSSFSL